MKKIFSTKEEADKYYNYLTTFYNEQESKIDYHKAYHTKKEAEESEEFTHSSYSLPVSIMTRAQFEKAKIKKREIIAHKGGRSEIISSMRVTEKEKQIIDEARKDLSYADYLVAKALKDVRRKNP